MEVHHHSHGHGKKNWRTYAWEFIMLFLAVFCGFLAEYFLEHRIEKEKGKQYVLSMIADLESDSEKIGNYIKSLKKQEVGLDSLSVLCLNPPHNDSVVKQMYHLMKLHTTNVFQLKFTKRTITQLSNSGGMRLIANKASADAITEYSEQIEGIERQGDYYVQQGVGEIAKLNRKIFNLKYTRGYKRKDKDLFFMKSHIVKLADNDEKLMTEYGNLTYFTSDVIAFYIKRLIKLEEEIPETIAILKKENHIE